MQGHSWQYWLKQAYANWCAIMTFCLCIHSANAAEDPTQIYINSGTHLGYIISSARDGMPGHAFVVIGEEPCLQGNDMWHPISFVADSRRVDLVMLSEFAVRNQDKYGILVEGGRIEVNTWYVDALVSDFKATRSTGK